MKQYYCMVQRDYSRKSFYKSTWMFRSDKNNQCGSKNVKKKQHRENSLTSNENDAESKKIIDNGNALWKMGS